MSDDSAYLRFLQRVSEADVARLKEKHQSYGNSCLKRGGTGFFFVFARKWDRMENILSRKLYDDVDRYDVVAYAERDPREEGIIDDIRDLRGYLLILEAELMARREKPSKEPFGSPDIPGITSPAPLEVNSDDGVQKS